MGDFVVDAEGNSGILHDDLDTGWVVYHDYTDRIKDGEDINSRLWPVLDIGQMIELLNPYGGIPVLVLHCTKHGYSIFNQDRDLINKEEMFESEELCDAFWQAVKAVL
jgi:hypothetical protein